MMGILNAVLELGKRAACKKYFDVARIFLRAKLAEQLYDTAPVIFLRLVHGVNNEVERFRRMMNCKG